MVIATQNPIEVEGTYPLPSAQLDRFIIKTVIKYPDRGEYIEIMRRFARYGNPVISEVIESTYVKEMQRLINRVSISDEILGYIADLIKEIEDDERVEWGVSPRGGIYIAKAAKAWALMNKRDFVSPEDVKRVFYPVINHRIILRPDALFKGITVDQVINDILNRVKVPV
jgi:MoxR-like ATPase